MTKKRESGLQRRIRKALEEAVGGFWWKVHGGPFQRAGIGDLWGLVCGVTFNFEVKTEDGELSKLQIETGKLIVKHGGVWACVVTPAEAVAICEAALQEVGLLSKARRQLRPRRKDSRPLIRARLGKDLDSRRNNRGAAIPIIRRSDGRIPHKS